MPHDQPYQENAGFGVHCVPSLFLKWMQYPKNIYWNMQMSENLVKHPGACLA